MTNTLLQDFTFFRMWPRKLFKIKAKGRLVINDIKELKRPGVYILYKGDELYYVGRASKLYSRLHDHSNKVTDEYYAHWDYFSAFALEGPVEGHKQKLAELEAILIAAMPRSTNRAKPRFKKFPIPRALHEIDDQ